MHEATHKKNQNSQNKTLADRDPFRASATPIYQTATFKQDTAEAFGEFDYSRTANPTRSILEQQLAKLEAGNHAFAFASGIAAIATLLKLVKPGQSIIAGDDLYGGTNRILAKLVEPLGIKIIFVDLTNLDAVRAAIDPQTTRLLLAETPTNPLQHIVDIQALAKLTHTLPNCILAVDNTMLSPHLQKPLTLGADIVIQSATKWLSGHGDLTAGALILNDPDLAEDLAFYQNAEGNALAPFEAFLLIRGIKTLGLRVDRQEANARAVADFLQHHPAVQKVYYAGLPEHPGYDIQRRQARGAGAVISFETGSRAASIQIVEALQQFDICVSFGSVQSTASLPCCMSHASIPKEIRCQRHLPEDLIRISVGIEDINDLIEDLDQALNATLTKTASALESPDLPIVNINKKTNPTPARA